MKEKMKKEKKIEWWKKCKKKEIRMMKEKMKKENKIEWWKKM
jgi:hypothetical protein